MILRKSSSTRSSKGNTERLDNQWSVDKKDMISESKRERRRKRKRLKSVPQVDSIGKERREQRDLEVETQLLDGGAEFTMDGLLSSFETEQSLKAKAAELRLDRPEFVARKAKPRKRIKGKPKRRHAKKLKLTGPNLYCFACKQDLEHFHNLKTSSMFSFFFGITLGLISLMGPYRCSVCSHKRLFGLNLLHPKYYIRHLLERNGEGYK